MTLKRAIEALVFASPKPLQTKEIAAALHAAAQTENEQIRAVGTASEEEIVALLAEIEAEYRETERPFSLIEQVNGWALVTNPIAAPWVRQLYPEAKPTRLSGPALETLAIIAYRQPVTRADIEAVRGVAVDGVMQVLLERSLVKIAGRAEVPGRPLLYSTTEYFLQHFGLKAVEELPNAQELRRTPLPTAAPPAEAAPAKEKAAPDKATEPTEATPSEPTPEGEAPAAEPPTAEEPPAAEESAAAPAPEPSPDLPEAEPSPSPTPEQETPEPS